MVILQYICAFLSVSFGFIVIAKNRQSALHKSFFFLCLCISTWLFLYAAANSSFYNSSDIRPLLFKGGYIAISFLPAIIYHHINCLILPANTISFPYKIYIASGLQALCIIFSEQYIRGFHEYHWGAYPAAGDLHYIFLFIFFLQALICDLTIYYYFINNRHSEKINKIQYALAGIIVFNFASMDFIPNYGIDIYPLGSVPGLIFISIYAFAIIKYHLMDFNLVFKRGVVYTLTLFIISFIYLIIIIITGSSINYMLSMNSPTINILSAFVLGLLFFPLRLKIQNYVDHHFFKGTFEEISKQNYLLMQHVSQSEKYRTLATLASGIAHEIRNPLTIIKTFTEYLPQKHHDEEFIQKYSSLTAREVTRIEDLVTQLMNYSKPNPPQFKATSIKKLIENSLDVLNNQLLSRKIRCTRNLELTDELQLKLDPNQIHQVLLNIVLNAIEAMPDGGDLHVKAHRQIVSPKKIIITFRDTGPGIPPEQLKQIFDPFFTSKDFGTGLGLAIVQSIMENHRGKIIARSRTGEGTEITIEFPLSYPKNDSDVC